MKLKRYLLYIKSHCEAPDYEDIVEAEDIDEAAEKFILRMPNCESKYDYDPSMLKRHIMTEEEACNINSL